MGRVSIEWKDKRGKVRAYEEEISDEFAWKLFFEITGMEYKQKKEGVGN